eukprot:2256256-Pleurochrysis_carterae.AAC.3
MTDGWRAARRGASSRASYRRARPHTARAERSSHGASPVKHTLSTQLRLASGSCIAALAGGYLRLMAWVHVRLCDGSEHSGLLYSKDPENGCMLLLRPAQKLCAASKGVRSHVHTNELTDKS